MFNFSLCRCPGTREIKSPWCTLVPEAVLSQRQSRPRTKGRADQLYNLSSVLLLTVQQAVSSHNEGRRKSAVKSNFCVAPRCPRGSLVPHESEKQISCAVHYLCCSSLSKRQSCPIQKQRESAPSGPSIAGPGAPMESRTSL